MRRLLAAALVLVVSACSGGGGEERGEPSVTPGGVAQDVGHEPRVERLGAVVGRHPDVPADLPAADAPLQSVLVDPPGEARLVYHPPEWWGDDVGWASETVMFLGSDDRWRRLDLTDLGLPESSWPGGDTYGAGALSPDGRWWAGTSRAGVVLMDLRTGEHRLVDLDTDWVAQVKWLPSSSAFVVAHQLGNRAGLRAHRVSVPHLRISPVPYDVWEVGFDPEGTPVTLRRNPDGAYDVVVDPGPREEVRGVLELPLLGRYYRKVAVRATEGRFAVITQGLAARRLELVVVSSPAHEVEVALRVDQRRVPLWDLWWLDPETLLLQTRDGLFVWDVSAGSPRRVAAGPPRNGRAWWVWTMDVATDVI